MPIPVIADVDTGVDDALALLFLASHPDIDLRAVTCVAGNASLPQVIANTLDVLDAASSRAAVAAGCDRPLIEPARDASGYHGANGIGNLVLPRAARRHDPSHAIEMIRRTIEGSAEPVTLLALAPMTNIALFLRLHPETAAKLERIVIMGGSAGPGNATPVAEFNVWHDPEAAQIVLESGVPTVLYPLDVFSRVVVDEQQHERLRAADTAVTQLATKLLDYQVQLADLPADIESGAKIGDAGTACFLVGAEHFGTSRHLVEVELAPGRSRGQTIIDRRLRPGEDMEHSLESRARPSDVALTVDGPAVSELFVSTLLGAD
ncbi:pyrimidine-specific ribonucleoside hydrolase [Paramicrobacterium humi]|uniref:Pyrimidine-specific ribonucleoside hydrolase n=1 Tax=Paramicrobacterium humi TaxID=640635 RepID=A0A1H4MUK6_9MICO|nr:nucleoside hydrolase [Microbacterium humi]SEB86348.1 pyrimidine-specific ribonucleoside hydrolase [Microbacterium humi]